MIKEEFIRKVNGKPWADRACNFDAMDCWGMVVLYYRHVLGLELHHMAGYESGSDFVTCYEQESSCWRVVPVPIDGCIAVFCRGEKPSHIGVMVSPVKCLHSRGEMGFVRCDSPLALLKVYNRVEYMVHGSI
ncbi:MAG: NlpC/P60 family protein [Enterobacteriaceae bacterium]|nr:NlpC/P60 family protein [Enterobacteriaceae bacterium]